VAIVEYSDLFWFPSGAIAADVPARVFLIDDNVFADLYTDATGTTPLPNPLNTAADGTLTFWAEEGPYWLHIDDETFRIHVGPDPAGPFLPLTGGTLTGDLTLAANPDQPLEAATKQYVDAGDATTLASAETYADSGDALKVSKAGDTMTGDLVLAGNPDQPLEATPKQYVDAGDSATLTAAQTYADTQDNARVAVAGDTMTGDLILAGDPTQPLEAATKQYVDAGDAATLTAADAAADAGDAATLASAQSFATAGDATRVSKAGDTMTGDLVLAGNPDQPLEATPKQYVDAGDASTLTAAQTYADTQDNARVAVAGDTMTGDLVLVGDPTQPLEAATKQYVDAADAATLASAETYADAGDSTRVAKAGDTMTGPLTITYGDFSMSVAHDLSVASSTGIVHPSAPITQAGPTSVNIPAGVAQFVDHTPITDYFTSVEYGPVTVSLDDPTDPVTYFMVDSTGAIVQNAGVPTRTQRRQFAILGRAVVIGGVIVSVQDSPILAAHPMAFAYDMLNALGDIRVDGIRASPIAASMTFSLTGGNIFNPGANYTVDPDDPNVSPFNAVSPAAFRYVTQSGVVGTFRTTIDPTIYDVGGTVTAVGGGSGTATIQRVHCFPTQNVFIQLGQSTYSSLAAAVDALAVGDAPSFVTHPDLRGGGVRTAFIVTTRTATNLADTTSCRVLRATRLGDPGGI
jgi:hypothetical protein